MLQQQDQPVAKDQFVLSTHVPSHNAGNMGVMDDSFQLLATYFGTRGRNQEPLPNHTVQSVARSLQGPLLETDISRMRNVPNSESHPRVRADASCLSKRLLEPLSTRILCYLIFPRVYSIFDLIWRKRRKHARASSIATGV